MEQQRTTENREGEVREPGMLIVLTGPTAAGKDTLGGQLLSEHQELQKITSFTTRGKREGEVDGTNYHFVDQSTFQEMAAQDAFVMVSQYGENYYGTPKTELLKILEGEQKLWIVSIETAGRMTEIIDEAYEPDIAQEMKDRLLVLFVGIERLTVLKDRYQSRNGDTEGLQKRLETDWKAWTQYESVFKDIIMNTEEPEDILIQALAIIEKKKDSINSFANAQQGMQR